MKFNKWTVGLAAVGVVSLASAAKAEEKANAIQTALSSTTISGYVDTSAHWNFGTGNANVAPYKFNSTGKSDGFNLDVVQIRIEKPLDEQTWAAGYKVDLWYGPDANTLGTQSTGLGTGTDFAIRQAYVNLRMPIGNGLDWKVGVFDSIIGYESVESGNNPNYTRSYGHSIEPQTHTGLLASYRFCDMFSASAGIADTVSSTINGRDFGTIAGIPNNYAESYKAYMGSIQITAPDSAGALAGSTFYGGVVNGYNSSVVGTGQGMPSLNSYIGATLATPIKELKVGIAWDRLDVNTQATGSNVRLNADAWSLAGYLSYQATEKLSLHARFEYVTADIEQPSALTGLAGNGIWGTTATIQYDLWKNVISRLEFRWDTCDHGNLFGGTTTGVPTRENAFLLAANFIYKF